MSGLLVKLGWDGAPLSVATWAAVMMVAASAIVVLLALRHRDAIPALVVVWALVGILVRFPKEPLMRAVGGVMIVVLIAAAGHGIWKRLTATAPGPGANTQEVTR